MPLAPPPAYTDLIERLGVRPLPEHLLREALTHASYLNETDATGPSNERLEFLGDAVLGMVIALEIYRLYPAVGEGELTRMRAEVVRGSTLAAAARRLALGEHLILGRGEEAGGGRSRDRNLAGAFEAVIGAVYLDQGYRTARALTRRLLGPELLQIKREGAQLDPKSALQHMVQARWHEPPEYVTVEAAADDHPRRFIVEVRAAGATLGRGAGRKKSEAQREAAREAIARLLLAGDGEA